MNKIKHMKSIIPLSIIVFSICVGSSPVLAEAVPQIEIPRSESSLAMQEYLESDPDLMASACDAAQMIIEDAIANE